MSEQPAPRRREPIINAPTIVLVTAGLLVAAHAGYAFASYEEQVRLLFEFAVVPRRFFAEAGSDVAYPTILHAGMTLLSVALLHADWLHVIVNAFMLLAFGTPVARALAGGGIVGAGKWMIVFLGAVAVGSIAFLAINGAGSGPAVGASGGTSGLIAAAFLLNAEGRVEPVWSRRFVSMTISFAVLNVILVLAGPALLGMGIAWEAHLGGYIAGAGLMILLGHRAWPGSRPALEPDENRPEA